MISNGIGVVVGLFIWFFGRNMMRKAAISKSKNVQNLLCFLFEADVFSPFGCLYDWCLLAIYEA